MVLWVDPIIKRDNSCFIPRRTRYRYSLTTLEPHRQTAKSCDVAMSQPMIAGNPTDAVRESITDPAGCTTADELATPRSLTFSSVSVTKRLPSRRTCQISARVNQGI